jgi:hypothetical protein
MDDTNPEGQLVFERTADLEAQLLEVSQVYNQVLGLMDRNMFDDLMKQYAAATLLSNPAYVSPMKANLGKVLSRSESTSKFASSAGGATDSALFVNIVQSDNRRLFYEFVILRRENGRWKLEAFLYA